MKALLFSEILLLALRLSIQDQCHTENLQSCMLELTTFATKHEIPLPSNEIELKEQCDILQTLQNCVHNYTTKCMSELERTMVQILFSSTVEKMKNLCTTGHEINAKFLKNAQCITENYGGVNVCLKTILAVIEALPDSPPSSRIPTLCCAVNHLNNCLSEHYSKQCTEEVVDLVEMVLEFAVTDSAVHMCTILAKESTCPQLPPPGTPLKETYKDNILGLMISEFVRQ